MDEQESNVQDENKIHKEHNSIGFTLILISACIFIFGLMTISGWEIVIVIGFSGFFFVLGALVLAIGNTLDYLREEPTQALSSKRSELLVAIILVSFAILWMLWGVPYRANGNGGFYELLMILGLISILIAKFELWLWEKVRKL